MTLFFLLYHEKTKTHFKIFNFFLLILNYLIFFLNNPHNYLTYLHIQQNHDAFYSKHAYIIYFFSYAKI